MSQPGQKWTYDITTWTKVDLRHVTQTLTETCRQRVMTHPRLMVWTSFGWQTQAAKSAAAGHPGWLRSGPLADPSKRRLPKRKYAGCHSAVDGAGTSNPAGTPKRPNARLHDVNVHPLLAPWRRMHAGGQRLAHAASSSSSVFSGSLLSSSFTSSA